MTHKNKSSFYFSDNDFLEDDTFPIDTSDREAQPSSAYVPVAQDTTDSIGVIHYAVRTVCKSVSGRIKVVWEEVSTTNFSTYLIDKRRGTIVDLNTEAQRDAWLASLGLTPNSLLTPQ